MRPEPFSTPKISAKGSCIFVRGMGCERELDGVQVSDPGVARPEVVGVQVYLNDSPALRAAFVCFRLNPNGPK